jgi:hypothetical protein
METRIVPEGDGQAKPVTSHRAFKPSASWPRIVEISRYIDEEYAATRRIDLDAAVSLAQAVLLFQNQLLGVCGRAPGRR